MSFSDIINSIFSFMKEDWVRNIFSILYAGGGATILTTYLKLKNKYKNVNDVTSTNTSTINTNIQSISTKQEVLEKGQQQNHEDIVMLTQAITALGNIISSVFVDSKAVSKDTKISISKSIAKLEELGLNMQVAGNVIKAVNTASQIAKEVVDEILEEQQVVAQEEQSKAEGTEEKAYDIYNKILEDYNE